MSKIRWLIWLTAALLAAPARSQIPLVVTPATPTDLAPNSLVQRASHNLPIAVNADLQWTGPVGGTLTRPLPSFFAICVYPAATPITCTWTNKTWSAPARGGTGLAYVPVPGATQLPFPGGSLTPRVPLPTALRYTYRPSSSLPAGWLNQPLKWVVGACIENAQVVGGMRCSFSGPKDLHFTSIDLVATNADMRTSTATELKVEVRATNPGPMDSPAGPFTIRLDIWEALTAVAPNNARSCETNWNIPQVVNNPRNYVVIFGRSAPIPVIDLLNGAAHDPNDIVAVASRALDGGSHFRRESVYTDSPLPTGLTSPWFVYGVNIPLNTTRKSFVAAAEFDWVRTSSAQGAIIEHNETNNLAVRCRSFY
jgi:hypothetical protein